MYQRCHTSHPYKSLCAELTEHNTPALQMVGGLSIRHCTLHHCVCRIQQSFREQQYKTQGTVRSQSRCLLPSDGQSITPSPGMEYPPARIYNSRLVSRNHQYAFLQAARLRSQQFCFSYCSTPLPLTWLYHTVPDVLFAMPLSYIISSHPSQHPPLPPLPTPAKRLSSLPSPSAFQYQTWPIYSLSCNPTLKPCLTLPRVLTVRL